MSFDRYDKIAAMSEFVSYMVIEVVKLPPGTGVLTAAVGKFEPLGLQVFRTPPRVNEYITKDVAGTGQAYKVLAVIHPMEPTKTGTSGDLIVEHIGTAVEVLRQFGQ